ncbi:MAG: hypothetical protein H0X37_20650 [Herpetosiphonaceae bacterium]|nr:hypothetical protein [Herpetosiphonaceae bacterium]
MLNEPVEITLLVTPQLEALNILYVIGGSVASIIWGEYRSTNDADVLAAIQMQHVEPLVQALGNEFFLQAEDMREAIRFAAHHPGEARTRPRFAVLHVPTAFKIDMFVSTDRPFEQAELARRIHEVVVSEPEGRAYIATAEDMVLAKLEWYQLGNEVSDKQWRDILAIIKLQGPMLDRVYMSDWATRLGIESLLSRAFAGAGNP